MYDDEEEIKAKRKKMMIIIGAVAIGLFILLLIFIAVKPSKKKDKEELKDLDCEIAVISDAIPHDGVYVEPIEVGFKSITPVSSEFKVTKKTIGTTDNARNKDTYQITKSGTYKLHGYVQDEAGNRKICDLEVVVSLTQPSCELEVKKGTLGEDGWYKSDVEVGFKTMSTNSELSSIKQYYIDQQIMDIEDSENIEPNIPNENKESYTVTDDLESSVIGYVIDSNGSRGICTLTVKKDSTTPTCTLKVKSGTMNQNGEYTDNPVIEFNTKTDDITEIASSGVGVETNYTEETYTVTAEGMTIVYGYVKDKAGNEGMCSLAVNRPKTAPTPTPTPEPTPTPTPEPTPTPSAKLLVEVVKKGDYVKYSAGTWNETSAERASSSSDYSWGYKAGASKDNGVKCRGKDDPGTAKNGWRVLGAANVNGTTSVVLLHAGSPECFYHARTSATNAASYMNQRAQSYLDGNFALQAKALDCTTLSGTCSESQTYGSSDTLFNIGTHYYLATPKSSTDTLWEVTSSGRLTGYSKMSNGLRPVIVLKANVKVSGGDGSQNNPWVLTW